jgi:hypothetical protein
LKPEKVPGLWTAEESPMPVDAAARAYFSQNSRRPNWRSGKFFEIASSEQERELKVDA